MRVAVYLKNRTENSSLSTGVQHALGTTQSCKIEPLYLFISIPWGQIKVEAQEAVCVLDWIFSDSALLLQLPGACIPVSSFPQMLLCLSRGQACFLFWFPFAATCCVWMWAYERAKGGCYVVVPSLLQPGIPTWSIQTTNSSYQGISCYCSLIGVLKPSFFMFPIPYNTQLPCLTGFCLFCGFVLLVMVAFFCFALLFPLLDSALTTHSLSTTLTTFPLCHYPAWVTFCSTLMPGACPLPHLTFSGCPSHVAVYVHLYLLFCSMP